MKDKPVLRSLPSDLEDEPSAKSFHTKENSPWDKASAGAKQVQLLL